ncbi:MAG TPA: hypothetical protein VFQ65_04875 [Kofleriaceae bacterium]|nr:hypothetical protein [Kofleriaceae bacterium]
MLARALAGVAALAATARARPIHGSVGIGGSLLATGDLGDRGRLDVELDVEPSSQFGALLALRGFDDNHHGLVCAGLVYEPGAARPTLVVDLHADLGADLDQHAPLAGGGIRTTIGVYGPVGIALDSGGYLVIDGVDRTRLVLSLGAAVVARW